MQEGVQEGNHIHTRSLAQNTVLLLLAQYLVYLVGFRTLLGREESPNREHSRLLDSVCALINLIGGIQSQSISLHKRRMRRSLSFDVSCTLPLDNAINA